MCFLVLSYLLKEMGRSDGNSVWMAGGEVVWKERAQHVADTGENETEKGV